MSAHEEEAAAEEESESEEVCWWMGAGRAAHAAHGIRGQFLFIPSVSFVLLVLWAAGGSGRLSIPLLAGWLVGCEGIGRGAPCCPRWLQGAPESA